jgi:putative protease
VHGSYCISFSGICYISSVHGGNSGNRGRCSQPCRDRYLTTESGVEYPLNLKDNSAYFDLEELADAGVDSLKIEGRIKKFDYVYTVVNTWRKQLQSFYNQKKLINDNSDLYKVFNRDFTNSFLKGDIHKDMFIDNPRDHSIKHLSEINDYSSNEELEKDQLVLYNEKENLKADIENKLKQISLAKASLVINISGECGSPLKVSVKTPNGSFSVFSEINLMDKGTETLSYEMVLKRFKAFNDTEFFIQELNLDFQGEVFIPFKELTSLKKRILFILNGSKELIEPVVVPVIKKHSKLKIKPSLSVLISSFNDINLCEETNANIYFQLPSCIKNDLERFIDFFTQNNKLIPWFPSVLIGDDFISAVELLKKVQPKIIVTNNTGIAYEACNAGIDWIAGPYLNIVNSYSLLSLKENFNCSGAFISNEICKEQIKGIKRPEDFNLYYSIYHPSLLMTSRQCLFHQVTGCQKNKLDDTCIIDCEKSSSITNLKKDTFFIEKSKGKYHEIYNETSLLNPDIIVDIPDVFSSFFIDLRDVKTKTKVELNKLEMVKLFEDFINEKPNSKKNLNQIIQPSTNTQYKKGI